MVSSESKRAVAECTAIVNIIVLILNCHQYDYNFLSQTTHFQTGKLPLFFSSVLQSTQFEMAKKITLAVFVVV